MKYSIKNKFSVDQILKAIFLCVTCIAIMLAFEILFSFDSITNSFVGIVENENSWLAWLGLWLIMFLQTCVIPIPALPIFIAADKMNMITFNILKDIPFYLIIMSAYILGVIIAYWIGYKWGKKAVKWVAGDDEEYNKWANLINSKGKWVYFCTVLLPIFPDDLLCLVCGSIKLNFSFFLLSNIIGRLIGMISTVYILITAISSIGGHWSIIAYSALLIVMMLTYIILDIKQKKLLKKGE